MTSCGSKTKRIARWVALVLAVSGSSYAVAADKAARVPIGVTIARAEHGDREAEAYLGWLYSIGSGVPQNYRLAADWFRCAASKGHGGAQFALGLLYNSGKGVKKDLVLSHYWLNLSAAQAHGSGRDFKVRVRDAVASKLTPSQTKFSEELATGGPGWRDASVQGLIDPFRCP